MILSDTSIKDLINSGKIKILPAFYDENIRPTGIRLHLGEEILVPIENQTIDLTEPKKIKYDHIRLTKKGFILKPDMFVLSSTYEKVLIPNYLVGHLEGRSTIARLGISIHCTSGIIDSMHNEPRSIVLELKNIGIFDLKIKPKVPIGLLLFSKLTSPIRQNSQSQYRKQDSVVGPNLKFQPKDKSHA